MTKEHISWKEELMYAKWCTMSNLAVPISRLYDFMDWILCSDDCWLVQTWQMLCGLKTILTDMNILNSYRHIRPKKVKYPIPEIPDDSGKKSGTDWVLPKIIGSGRVSGTRQALLTDPRCSPGLFLLISDSPITCCHRRRPLALNKVDSQEAFTACGAPNC